MYRNFFYSLSSNISIRDENEGVVLLLSKGEVDKDYDFFYASDPYLFKKMIDEKALLKVSIDSNKSADNEKKILFLSGMLKEGILFCYMGDIEKKEVVELKEVPEMRYLFITPTTHFRKVYSYEK